VVEIDAASRQVKRSIPAGPFARGLAITRDGGRLFVTEYHTGNVVALDLASGEVSDRWVGISSDNLARQVALHPTRDKAYLPHIRSATEHAHGEGSIFPYVSVLDTAPAASQGRSGASGSRWTASSAPT
jgi:DNA-binding beta-propeller fold protein YncE